ncbi:hypothetical protein V8E36_009832 [Tilletia maclaganii]
MKFTLASASASLLLLASSTFAAPEATAAPSPLQKRADLPTGTDLNSLFSTVLASSTNDLSSIRASITSAGLSAQSSLRAGVSTRTSSPFQSGTAASCLFPSIKANTAYCCPGGDIIDGTCYANGSGQFVDSTYFQQNSFNPPTSTASSGNTGGMSGLSSLMAAGAAALVGAVLIL